jgi:hypothetical protein
MAAGAATFSSGRRAPFLFRNELVSADGLAGEDRAAEPGEVRRLGKHVAVVSPAVEGGSRIEIAAPSDEREQALGPFAAHEPGTGTGTGTGDRQPVRVVIGLPGWEDFPRTGLDDVIAAAVNSPMVLIRLRSLLKHLQTLRVPPPS